VARGRGGKGLLPEEPVSYKFNIRRKKPGEGAGAPRKKLEKGGGG